MAKPAAKQDEEDEVTARLQLGRLRKMLDNRKKTLEDILEPSNTSSEADFRRARIIVLQNKWMWPGNPNAWEIRENGGKTGVAGSVAELKYDIELCIRNDEQLVKELDYLENDLLGIFPAKILLASTIERRLLRSDKDVATSVGPNFVFVGNPGTGKSTLGEAFGKMATLAGWLEQPSEFEMRLRALAIEKVPDKVAALLEKMEIVKELRRAVTDAQRSADSESRSKQQQQQQQRTQEAKKKATVARKKKREEEEKEWTQSEPSPEDVRPRTQSEPSPEDVRPRKSAVVAAARMKVQKAREEEEEPEEEEEAEEEEEEEISAAAPLPAVAAAVAAEAAAAEGVSPAVLEILSERFKLLTTKEMKEMAKKKELSLRPTLGREELVTKLALARVIRDISIHPERVIPAPRSMYTVKASRANLVAAYTGQTTLATLRTLLSALGKVLFIDEAYNLVSDDDDAYGKEAVGALVEWIPRLSGAGLVMFVVAGYEDRMQKNFFAQNVGLASRFRNWVKISDYTPRQLTTIFSRKLVEAKWIPFITESGATKHLFPSLEMLCIYRLLLGRKFGINWLKLMDEDEQVDPCDEDIPKPIASRLGVDGEMQEFFANVFEVFQPVFSRGNVRQVQNLIENMETRIMTATGEEEETAAAYVNPLLAIEPRPKQLTIDLIKKAMEDLVFATAIKSLEEDHQKIKRKPGIRDWQTRFQKRIERVEEKISGEGGERPSQRSRTVSPPLLPLKRKIDSRRDEISP